MPRLKLTEQQEMDAALRQAIFGSAGYFQLGPNEMAAVAGVKRATWYRRLKIPGDFSVKELRRMVKRYGWTSETVAKILGAKITEG